MIRRIAYLKRAAFYFIRNSRSVISPKGVYQNIRYYLIFPLAFIGYMQMANRDWPRFKLIQDKKEDKNI